MVDLDVQCYGQSREAVTSGNDSAVTRFLFGRNSMEIRMARGLLLWLVGLPFPMIVLIWLLGGLALDRDRCAMAPTSSCGFRVFRRSIENDTPACCGTDRRFAR